MFKSIAAWFVRPFASSEPSPAKFVKKTWAEFADIPAENYVRSVSPEELVELASYRRDERIQAAGGIDPIRILPAYSQDRLIYSTEGRMVQAATGAAYGKTPAEHRVNKFGQAYRSNAPLLLHSHLADILINAATFLQRTQGWNTVVFDGLRTMEGGFLMYHRAKAEWLTSGLLSPPGRSAHNRALAVDSMQFDAKGNEIDMGGHFDHLVMRTNHRNYSGNEITEAAKKNRIVREQAWQRAALTLGTAIAPLREEFWDDRVPGSEMDLWRVMESICRSIGQEAPATRAEDYATFAAQWETHLDQEKLRAAFGEVKIPEASRILYHECLKPIYDHELPPHWQQAIMNPGELGG